jgi:predicted  nucleic acid-binding Zn-ribbon protein
MGGAPQKRPDEIMREQAISKKMAELSERTRLIEERVKQLRQKVNVVDETSLKKFNDLKAELGSLSEQLSSMRKDFEDTKEIIRRIAKDMGSTARLSDVRVLEKYINMVDITRLVTKEDVINIIRDELEEIKHEKKKG